MKPNRHIRGSDEFHTNIKNLPEGDYVTQTMYSDAHPYVVIASTAKTLTVLPVKVKPDPDWKPEILPGGFTGRCTNQHAQTWLYDGVDESAPPRKLYLRKSRYGGSDFLWASPQLGEFSENNAREFHDYNF
jgi:hypothetical protein